MYRAGTGEAVAVRANSPVAHLSSDTDPAYKAMLLLTHGITVSASGTAGLVPGHFPLTFLASSSEKGSSFFD